MENEEFHINIDVRVRSQSNSRIYIYHLRRGIYYTMESSELSEPTVPTFNHPIQFRPSLDIHREVLRHCSSSYHLRLVSLGQLDFT